MHPTYKDTPFISNPYFYFSKNLLDTHQCRICRYMDTQIRAKFACERFYKNFTIVHDDIYYSLTLLSKKLTKYDLFVNMVIALTSLNRLPAVNYGGTER